jgi:hypothetical protein
MEGYKPLQAKFYNQVAEAVAKHNPDDFTVAPQYLPAGYNYWFFIAEKVHFSWCFNLNN